MHLRNSRHKLLEPLAVSLVIVVLVICGWLTLMAFRQLQDDREKIAHTHEVLLALEAVVAVATDGETGQRGFIITGREEYLEPYTEARDRVDKVVSRLATLTADNEIQQSSILSLRKSLQEKFAELDFATSVRRDSGMEAATLVVDTDIGKRTMNAIRDQIAQMREIESKLLHARATAAMQSYRSGTVTSVMSTIVGLALVGGLIGLMVYIRRRSEADAALIHAERERLRVTLASIGDAVISTDRNGVINYLNQVAESLTGWTNADANGKRLDEVFRIINENSRQVVESPATRALREGIVVGLANHTLLVSKDGRETPIDDSASPIRNAHGKIVGVVLIFRDVTNRNRELNELAKLAAELSDADRRKNEYLATLAHELRNPLAPIKNAVQLMGMSELDDEIESLRQIMERQVNQLVHLIDDLMDVSRISRGKIALRRVVVDLASIVDAAVEASSTFVAESGQELSVKFESDEIYIYADPARITQVISNLLNNSAKYSNAGCRIDLNIGVDGDQAVIRVQDNGIGIESNRLQDIFQMFSQINNSLERGTAGLGIGLMLVKSLVELHGGTVLAESEGKDRGSTFTVRLPLADPMAVAEEPSIEDSEVNTRTFRILIVEDQRALRFVLARLLEKMGHKVESAESGPAAIKILEEFQPEIIFSDISMPGMTGYELARQLRTRAELANVHFVAMTGYGQSTDRQAAINSGFDDHMVKPVDAEHLHELFSRIATPS